MYKLHLEDFLDIDMKEVYFEQFKRCFQVPLSIEEKLEIENEIREINKRLNEYERFNTTRRNQSTDNETIEGNQ
jgi:hypothetical protein